MQLFSPQIHKWIYFFGLSVIAIGMPLSEFLMSLGQFIVLGNWLIEGGIVGKLKCFWKNKMAVLVSSVILMHLLGLFYTNDFEYAFSDIRIKAPILVLPLLISTSVPLSKQLFDWLMTIFVASVVVGTFISMGVYYGMIQTKAAITDIRDISIFISHIRFSLLICLSIFISAWYLYFSSSLFFRIVFICTIIWLSFFLTILDSLTGIFSLVIVLFILAVYGVFAMKSILPRVLSILGVLGIIIGVVLYISPLTKSNDKFGQDKSFNLGATTALGNAYQNDTANFQLENGNRVWLYICWSELEQGWDKRSVIKFNDYNKRGDLVKYTLVRYLTSKGLRKDAASIESLGDAEVSAIESGIANVNYIGKSSVTIRIMETLWEFDDYKNGGNINGHSALMRMEFGKAGWNIFKNHPLIGVGTGDIKNAYAAQYNNSNSPLDKAHRLRSHNQYLSIAVAFGFFGLLWFLIALIYPFVRFKMWNNYIYSIFFIIALLSMFTEDTLETQAGVTFYAFFNSILLFAIAPATNERA